MYFFVFIYLMKLEEYSIYYCLIMFSFTQFDMFWFSTVKVLGNWEKVLKEMSRLISITQIVYFSSYQILLQCSSSYSIFLIPENIRERSLSK